MGRFARPFLALLIVAIAASVLALPALAFGGPDPLAQMQKQVDRMERAVVDALDELEDELANASSPEEQEQALAEARESIEAQKQQKIAAVLDIAGEDPLLQEAAETHIALIEAIAQAGQQAAAALFENADPPPPPTSTTTIPLPTTTSVPSSSTTSVPPSSTTTTRPPHQTTTTTQPKASTTTTTIASGKASPPASTTSTTSTTTTTIASVPPPLPPADTGSAAAAGSSATTTTTPPLLAAGGPAAAATEGGLSLGAIDEALAGEEFRALGSIDDSLSSQADIAGNSLAIEDVTGFQVQTGLMDGTVLLVDYFGNNLPAPVAAPVISLIAILEMVMRAFLSGTRAFVGPAFVFGAYAGYRSLITYVARRRVGAV